MMKRILLGMILGMACGAIGIETHKALGQCRGGNCQPAAPIYLSAPVQVPAPGNTWSDGWFRHEDGHIELWQGGRLVKHSKPGDEGWEDTLQQMKHRTKRVLGLVSVERSQDCRCGADCDCVDCPAECAGRTALQPRWMTNGVMRQTAPIGEVYRLNGQPVPKERALKQLAGPPAPPKPSIPAIPDDSTSNRIVVVGSDAGRKQIEADWLSAPDLAPFKAKTILQGYTADRWEVANVGYTQTADPTVYVVDAGGKVLHRQEGYTGPGPLAAALRKADPAFDPSKSPDLTKQPAKPAPGSAPDPLLLGGATAIAALGLAGAAKKLK